MNFKTKLLLKLQYDFNQNIINKKLVGHGVSRIENDLINKITISENIELDISLATRGRLLQFQLRSTKRNQDRQVDS